MQLHGLDILIERMQSHPHEFTHEGKWTEILTAIDKHLTDEERQTLKQGFADMARGMFNEAVLKGIANEPVEFDMIEIIQHSYDSVLAYPLERQRALEREKKEEYQRQIELEKMQLQRHHAMQGMQGMGGLGQSQYQPKGIW
jgi:hypothetical protein